MSRIRFTRAWALLLRVEDDQAWQAGLALESKILR